MDISKLIQVLTTVALLLVSGAVFAHLTRCQLQGLALTGTPGKASTVVTPVRRRAFSFRLSQTLVAIVVMDFLFLRQPFAEPLLWGPVLLGSPLICVLAIKDYFAREPGRDVLLAIGISIGTAIAVVALLASCFRLG